MRYVADERIFWASHARTVEAGEVLDLTEEEAAESRHFKPMPDPDAPPETPAPKRGRPAKEKHEE